MPEQTTKAFDSSLLDLRRTIAEMGGIAETQSAAAITALLKSDTPLARRVIAADEAIDRLQRDIETMAIATIARGQPTARDLREIVGTLRISIDLERIGDLAKNVAKRVVALGGKSLPPSLARGIDHMTEMVLGQLKNSLDSYVRRDLAAALEVWKGDEDVDAITNSLVRELLTLMVQDPQNIRFGIHLLFCAKNIERVGDHATNIAEVVHLIMEGHALLDVRPKVDCTSIPWVLVPV
jgi:phosphate transport system protein